MALTAFKTRIYPNNKQATTFNRWAGSRRYAYNYAVRMSRQYREDNEGKLPFKRAKRDR